jgi:hypothetical protein
MGSESEKGSRLNQRNFGVTNRIWLIVSLFLFIIMFTHFVLPTHQPQQRTPYSATNLRPKNYLNGSDTEPNPFAFCPPYNPGDELGAKYGTQVLSKSRLHHGSGDRIQQVLNRALAGLPVTISVLGGSGAFVVYAPNGSFSHFEFQFLPATVLVMTPYPPNATQPCSSTGGTPSFPIPRLNLPMGPCDVQIQVTLASAVRITSQTLQTSSLSNWTAKIFRRSFYCL